MNINMNYIMHKRRRILRERETSRAAMNFAGLVSFLPLCLEYEFHFSKSVWEFFWSDPHVPERNNAIFPWKYHCLRFEVFWMGFLSSSGGKIRSWSHLKWTLRVICFCFNLLKTNLIIVFYLFDFRRFHCLIFLLRNNERALLLTL